MSMNKLAVGVILSKYVYCDDSFKPMLENHFAGIAGKLHKRLREEFGEDLPEDKKLKIEIVITPFLEDTK